MSLESLYSNNVKRKKAELIKLRNDRAKYTKDLSDASQRILRAERQLKNTRSSSAMNNKINEIKKGEICDLCIFNLEEEYEINPEEFISMGKSTPFAGEKVFGRCIATIYKDNVVYGNLESYKEEV